MIYDNLQVEWLFFRVVNWGKVIIVLLLSAPGGDGEKKSSMMEYVRWPKVWR